MKLIFSIFILAASINLAHCSGFTGPFEAIFFYYAYQIDAAAAARAAADGVPYEATIGGDCINKDCTLLDFIEKIMNADLLKKLTPTTRGATTSPDVYDTALDIDRAWNYDGSFLQKNVIIKNGQGNMGQLVTAVVNKIQTARAVVPSADLVAKATVALKWAQAVRLTELVIQGKSELTGYKAEAFAKDYPSITLASTQRILDEDRTVSPSLHIVYTDLDYASMALQTATGDLAGVGDTYREFLSWAQAVPGDSKYRSHQALADVYKRSVASLEAGCS
ncbi:uncharacterized protein BO66DRAFT_332312 [Aspergillus aculeatinus CBS 121060]|uniref:Uncharacterized protein n=1 Tax=Aspergillus aculeatinus CBS 121060 TaxID=1448322 RepID=A0ACD1GY24_9EURO|nr:hypothetical protein BO66DRAFT_332312 [Aspergillus aculeatinus CBS 121060]RAH66080.1 hypothetical protein BO66DRAFT_332312 [Aspergillus aculeatinus CBS 121060]